jgi:hypothetical protein
MIIFDLDGTIALIDHRRHFVEGEKKDWDAFYQACDGDRFNWPVVRLLKRLYGHHPPIERIEIWSGRCESVRAKTLSWLERDELPYDRLRMRPKGDFTPDDELKRRWLDEHNAERGWDKVSIVFDDRDKVVAMWRSQGICCCQVAPGDF